MAVVPSSDAPSIVYPPLTLARAERALRCAPFQLVLFSTMYQQSVPLLAIAQEAGVQNQYTQIPLSERAVEDVLLWLIQVGILRREVDGQGLTDSFRLTPLGRQLVEQWQHAPSRFDHPTYRDRLYNAFNRWLSFWNF